VDHILLLFFFSTSHIGADSPSFLLCSLCTGTEQIFLLSFYSTHWYRSSSFPSTLFTDIHVDPPSFLLLCTQVQNLLSLHRTHTGTESSFLIPYILKYILLLAFHSTYWNTSLFPFLVKNEKFNFKVCLQQRCGYLCWSSRMTEQLHHSACIFFSKYGAGAQVSTLSTVRQDGTECTCTVGWGGVC
jgi:hypothetical protein